MNVLTDAQVDNMMLVLEAAFSQTGNKSILQVLDIITNKDSFENLANIVCPVCGKKHPLVAMFGYCGKCAKEIYDLPI